MTRAVSKRRELKSAARLVRGGVYLAAWSLCAALSAPVMAQELEQAGEAGSVYSPVEPAECLLFQNEPLGSGRVCAGEHGYNLVLSDFDGRLALELVRADWPRNVIIPVTAVAPEFSWVAGTVAEWRSLGDAPTGLILRVGVSAERERADEVETRLLVIKLGGGLVEDVCLVGAVSGRGGGNIAARAMAEQAAGLPCIR